MGDPGRALLLFFGELLAYVLGGYLKEKHEKLPAAMRLQLSVT